MRAYVITMAILMAVSTGITLETKELGPGAQVSVCCATACLAAWGFWLLFQ